MLIFLFPMALSLVAAVVMLFGDHGLLTKILVVALAGAALALQFAPPLAGSVHFLVPLFMQLIVCGWWYFADQLE